MQMESLVSADSEGQSGKTSEPKMRSYLVSTLFSQMSLCPEMCKAGVWASFLPRTKQEECFFPKKANAFLRENQEI